MDKINEHMQLVDFFTLNNFTQVTIIFVQLVCMTTYNWTFRCIYIITKCVEKSAFDEQSLSYISCLLHLELI